MINPRRVAEEDELDQRIEHIIDTQLVVALKRRLDVFVDRLSKRMGALMEARHEVNSRHNRVPNPTVDLEDVEYDIYFKGDANIFIEENLSDDAFFLAKGDGEPDFDEDDKGDDKDDKEADAVWEAVDKRMDSRRKDRREARLEQEIEKYRVPNQQMKTRMSDVSIEPVTAAEYFESEFFPIIRSEAWADIGFRSSMEDVYV
ncbi:hypothetical protein CDL15_Pgr006297 [Punica granatum]|nr:hypothetical protein CDL15_Pgr006297 [Punica granatum]